MLILTPLIGSLLAGIFVLYVYIKEKSNNNKYVVNGSSLKCLFCNVKGKEEAIKLRNGDKPFSTINLKVNEIFTSNFITSLNKLGI